MQTNLDAVVPQGSKLVEPLLFLIYINYLVDELSSNVELFIDDTSFSSVVHEVDRSAAELNYELAKKSHLAHQWKMSFNPDPSN